MKKAIVKMSFDGSVERGRDFQSAMSVHGFSAKEISISDGYHTMDELYDHRITLFIALCLGYSRFGGTVGDNNWEVWRSKEHYDPNFPMYPGWFVMGIGREKGKQITYHLPIDRWGETEFAETLDRAPEFDGHTPADVLNRIKNL